MKSHRTLRALGALAAGITAIPLLLAVPTKAFGYTDPGTGTFAYQAMYAAFIGGTFYLRRFVKRFFNKRPEK